MNAKPPQETLQLLVNMRSIRFQSDFYRIFIDLYNFYQIFCSWSQQEFHCSSGCVCSFWSHDAVQSASVFRNRKGLAWMCHTWVQGHLEIRPPATIVPATSCFRWRLEWKLGVVSGLIVSLKSIKVPFQPQLFLASNRLRQSFSALFNMEEPLEEPSGNHSQHEYIYSSWDNSTNSKLWKKGINKRICNVVYLAYL